MTLKTFRLLEGSEQQKFVNCRLPIAGMTGGFGNGKTAALSIVALRLAAEYRNARVLVGRATSRKLADSTQKEVMSWVPQDWVARAPNSRTNDLVLKETNSTIEFRHVRQEGAMKGEAQSNLLSATYDAALIDQMDDPEFTFKDFEDIQGRLRGTAEYIGDDPTMPQLGPQWMRFTANPTRNWLFREVVGPYFTFKKTGITTSKLLRYADTNECIVAVFNTGTRANSRNTGENYARRMESVFRGSMKKRMVDGDWSAYEGLVYPDFGDGALHVIQQEALVEFIRAALKRDELGVVEGYDYGQASPSCYLLAFYNDVGDVMIVDGFYEPNMRIERQAKEIKRIRRKWMVIPTEPIWADPDIFRKKQAQADKPAEAVSNMFAEHGIVMQRGDNSIGAGIEKVSSYLAVHDMHRNPVTLNYGAPHLFVGSDVEFWQNEIVDYYWNKNTAGENVDKPMDRNDHSMDATKYLLTRLAKVVGVRTFYRRERKPLNPAAFQWHEVEEDARQRLLPRHR